MPLLSLALPLMLSAVAGPRLQLAEANRVAEAVVDPASDAGERAMAQFVLPEGMSAQLWAAEPMLANPVAFAMDYSGKVYVAETYRYGTSTLDIRSYMKMLEVDLASRTIEDRERLINEVFGTEAAQLAIESERVRVIEDGNGDGRADRAWWMAEGFDSALDGVASGVLPHKGDVYLANIPSLWRLGDLDADGRATRREELLRGFGVHFGFTGHDLHGLIMGPDGKLYFSIGDRGTSVPTKEGGRIELPDTGAVFRSNLDGTQLELYAWGLRNPQELAFDELGNLFTFDNDCDNGDRERLVQVVQGGDSGWRIGYQYAPLGKAGPWMLEGRWKPRFDGQPQDFLPPITNIQDGPSGVAYYPGTGLHPRYDRTFFVAQFKGSLTRSGIATYRLKPAGASFELDETGTFLSGALATDVLFGHDGKLYYTDWVEAWPKSRRGRIYVIGDPSRADDPLAQETQALLSAGMTDRSETELGALLGHADQRVRLEAQWELAARAGAGETELAARAVDRAAPLLARLHGLWGLGQLAGTRVETTKIFRRLLADPESEVRGQAAKLLGDHRVASASAELMTALADTSPRVKFFAAQSLGLLPEPGAAPALVEVLRQNADADVYLRHAAVMGLAGGRNDAVLAAMVSDAAVAVRRAGLLTWRRLRDPRVALYLNDPDPALVAEAAMAINDDAIDAARPALAALISRTGLDPLTTLRVLNAQFREGQPANAAALANFAADGAALDTARVEALHHLAAWPSPPARDRIVGDYRPLAESSRPVSVATSALGPFLETLCNDASGAVQAAVIEVVRSTRWRDAEPAVWAVLEDESREAVVRVAALQTLAALESPRFEEAVRLAGNSLQSEVRLGALPHLARLAPAESMAVIRHMVATGSVAEMKAAFGALAEIPGDEADAIFVAALGRLAAGEVPVPVQLELLEAAASRPGLTVIEALAARDAALAASGDPLAPFQFALQGGNARAGRTVFSDHPVLSCVRCHMVSGNGGEAGPDLTAAGLLKPAYLLESIIKPNAHIAEGFDTVMLTLDDGSSVAGTLKRDDATTLQLALPDGSLREVPASRVTARESAPSSMPEIYGLVLSKTELRDLMAYLKSLKPLPASEGHGGDEEP